VLSTKRKLFVDKYLQRKHEAGFIKENKDFPVFDH